MNIWKFVFDLVLNPYKFLSIFEEFNNTYLSVNFSLPTFFE